MGSRDPGGSSLPFLASRWHCSPGDSLQRGPTGDPLALLRMDSPQSPTPGRAGSKTQALDLLQGLSQAALLHALWASVSILRPEIAYELRSQLLRHSHRPYRPWGPSGPPQCLSFSTDASVQPTPRRHFLFTVHLASSSSALKAGPYPVPASECVNV